MRFGGLLALLLAAGPAAAREGELQSYVGAAVCGRCHRASGGAATCPVDAAAHARAFDALSRGEASSIAFLSGVAEPPVESPLCRGCHATGADEGPRWQAPTFRIADGVQCEACHGPRGGHARSGARSSGALLAIAPREDLCRSCHLPRASHREVLEAGYRRPPVTLRYKNPGRLALSARGDRLYVAGERSDSLLVVDPVAGTVTAEIPVDPEPMGIAVHPDGQRVYVTSRRAGTVAIVDVAAGRVVARAAVGAEPHGVVIDASGTRLFVLSTGADVVFVLDAGDLRETARLAAGPGPWGAALRSDGALLAVTHVRPSPAPYRAPHASELMLVDPAAARVTRRVAVPDANTLQSIAFVPGRDVALFALMRSKNLVPTSRLGQGWVASHGLGVLWPDGRVDQVLLDDPADAFADPTGIALAPDGRVALVTAAGTDEVAVVDVAALLDLLASTPESARTDDLPHRLGAASRFVVRRVGVGRNPRAAVFSKDGRRAYVAATLDDAVTVLETDRFTVTGVIPLGGPAAISETRRGERLFHSAAATSGRQFSCRSCHPEGHTNGLTLDIDADGAGLKPVDVRSLRGVFDTGPFKWEGSNASIARQCGPRLAVFFARLTPLPPEDLAALVRFVATIGHPPNPRRPAEGLTPAQRRGKQIFDRQFDNDGAAIPPEGRCVNCHSGPYRTALRQSMVGTDTWFDAPAPDVHPIDLDDEDALGPLGTVYFSQKASRLRPLDDSHLRGVAASPPYLHNGAAASLEEIWTRFNLYEWHGRTHDLTRAQLNDLIEYLKSL